MTYIYEGAQSICGLGHCWCSLVPRLVYSRAIKESGYETIAGGCGLGGDHDSFFTVCGSHIKVLV